MEPRWYLDLVVERPRVFSGLIEPNRVLQEHLVALGFTSVVELAIDNDWVGYALVGWTEGRQPFTVRGLLVVPAEDVPEGGLAASVLRKSFGLRDAPARSIAEGLRASAEEAGAEPSHQDWLYSETYEGHRHAYKRRPPPPGERVPEEALIDFAETYLMATRGGSRGIYTRMQKAYKKRDRTYSVEYLRDRVHDATEAGLLPKRTRGVVATQPTEKLLEIRRAREEKR